MRTSNVNISFFYYYIILELTQFAIAYKSRYNGDLNRENVITAVADMVIDGEIKHQVDLDNPDVVVVIEIVKVCYNFSLHSLLYMNM